MFPKLFYRPIFMNERKEQIHQMRNGLEAWRDVVSHINGFFAEPSAELGNIGDSSVIQGPQGVFVERLYAFFEPDLDAV